MPPPLVPSPHTPATNFPFFFSWVPPHSDFDAGTMLRQDELVFSLDITQSEGQAATATLVIQNPHIGLLNPARNTWAWLSWNDYLGTMGAAGTIYPLFYGRLVSIPSDMISEAITIQLVAMPTDLLAQKQAIAATLQQRPNWDPALIDEPSRLDPDNVLEGYSRFWHIDRGSQGLAQLPVTTSDVLVGEDGLIDFLISPDDAFYDTLRVTVDKPPLQSVYVDVTVTWNQQVDGYLDMGILNPGTVLTGQQLIDNWPKSGTQYGGGWSCFFSQAYDLNRTADVELGTTTAHYKNTDDHHAFGDVMSSDVSWSRPIPVGQPINPAGTIFGLTKLTSQFYGNIISVTDIPAIISESPNFKDQPTAKVSVTTQYVIFSMGGINLRQVLEYKANRPRTETVRFTLGADLQPVFTDPGGAAANFAQDSELLSLNGNVGNEGPYGRFVGTWAPGVLFLKYDYFTVALGGFVYGYTVTRDNVVSLPAFDPNSAAVVWEPLRLYPQGEIVFADGLYWIVVVAHESGVAFNPSVVDFNGTRIYQPQINPDAGQPTYQLLPHFTGLFLPGYTYTPGDIIVAPSNHYYKVLIGHTSAATFDQYASDATGRMLYALMLNPPAIGDLAAASYFPSDRGAWTIEYAISRARAQLLDRSRAVKVSFDVPFMAQGIQLSCRYNATIADHRLPGGQAFGKIVSYSLKADGENAPVCSITIACCVGNGNPITPNLGTPSYVDVSYVESGYQYFTGQQVVATDVAYTVPSIDPNGDDGLNLLIPLTKADVVVASQFVNPNNNNQTALHLGPTGNPLGATPTSGVFPEQTAGQYPQLLQAASQAFGPEDTALSNASLSIYQAVQQVSAYYYLVLKPVTNGPFDIEYDVETSIVPLPLQINLAANSVP